MKAAWLVLLLLLCCISGIYAQKNTCDCEAFLSTEFTWEKQVYAEPNKSVAYEIGNNAMDEDFIHLTILAQKKEWLLVAPYGIHKWYDTGWIDNSHIAVYGKNYAQPINIYKKDDASSAVVQVVPVHFEPEYHVTGCKGKWLQVEFTFEDKLIKGWMSPKDQCGSAYTNCN